MYHAMVPEVMMASAKSWYFVSLLRKINSQMVMLSNAGSGNSGILKVRSVPGSR